MKKFGIWIAGVAALFAGCSHAPGTPRDEPIPTETVERARALTKTFKGNLMEALTESLNDGPAETIGVCAVMAPEIAADLSVDGVRIGRSSHRLRNPANESPDWVRPLIEEYRREAPGAEPRSVRIDDATVGYVEPLYVGQPCLVCHGEAVPEEVQQEILAVYPQDEATGFREGEFRGVIWVEIR
jgi:hypothetical protein